MMEILPLKVSTPDFWAVKALENPLELLSDHAHLEKKAAANALALIHRWPEGKPSEKWTKELSDIARDESQHLSLVLKLMEERGGALSKMHRNCYAHDLRLLIRSGEAEKELLDRLIISALIEVRSSERFKLLSESGCEVALAKLYRGLYSSELGHYKSFLYLAEEFLDREEVSSRWEWFLEEESRIIKGQTPGCRIHSWFEKA